MTSHFYKNSISFVTEM